MITIRSQRTFWIPIGIICLLGAGLRIYGLTRQAFWLDEVNGVRIAEKSYRQIVSELQYDVSPPLHYFMLHTWIKIFGSSDLSTRGFASLFGILLIPTLCYIGSSIFDRRVGLIAGFIASIAPFHIRYSQEARMYSMLALLSLLSTYFVYRVATTGTRASWVGYTVCTVLTIYTHYYGIFVAIAGVLFFFIYAMTHSVRLGRFLIAQCVIVALYLPWLPVLIGKHFGSSTIVGWIPPIRLYHIYETFKMYTGLNFMWLFRPTINSLVVCAAFILFLCCFLGGIFSVGRYKRIVVPVIQNNTGLVLLLCYLLVTLAVPMLISIKKPIYISCRYSIAAWPAFALISGVGISMIKRPYRLAMVLAAVLFVSFASLYGYYFVWVKTPDRLIAGFIESKGKQGDLVVFVPVWIEIPINYHLRMPVKGLGYPWSSMKERPEDISGEKFPRKPDAMADLAKSRLAGGSGKVFVVYKESVTWVAGMQAVRRVFDESFEKMETKRYGEIEIIIYKQGNLLNPEL
jgi:uncharacterized membrane protein